MDEPNSGFNVCNCGAVLPEDKLKEEWEKLRLKLGDTSKWTVGESANYFGFFCHGWYGRVNTAAYQWES